MRVYIGCVPASAAVSDMLNGIRQESVRRVGECGPLDISARNAGYFQIINVRFCACVCV